MCATIEILFLFPFHKIIQSGGRGEFFQGVGDSTVQSNFLGSKSRVQSAGSRV